MCQLKDAQSSSACLSSLANLLHVSDQEILLTECVAWLIRSLKDFIAVNLSCAPQNNVAATIFSLFVIECLAWLQIEYLTLADHLDARKVLELTKQGINSIQSVTKISD